MSDKIYSWTLEEADKMFFTSDTHFGHENVIKYCRRPFNNIQEHDDELVRRWNDTVPEDGIVFHLGDVAFGTNKRTKEILEKLHGKIYLVIGNHDWKCITSQHKWRFEGMTQQMSIKVGSTKIILNHYPMLCFAGTYNRFGETWQLFGHVHSGPYSDSGLDNQRLSNLFTTQYDVGVDNNDFRPISFKDVRKIILEQMMFGRTLNNMNIGQYEILKSNEQQFT